MIKTTHALCALFAALGFSACMQDIDSQDLVGSSDHAVEVAPTPADGYANNLVATSDSKSGKGGIMGLIGSPLTVDLARAPGADGVQNTGDDIVFSFPWSGPTIFGHPRANGDEWTALGLRFEPIGGAIALSNASGCFGSQLASPASNWDGSLRITFVDPATGAAAVASEVTIALVNPPATARAYDSAGNLLSTQSLAGFSQNLAIGGQDIARIDIDGDFWCIFNNITFTLGSANSAPEAVCSDITLAADASCEACGSVDGGSFDPDGDAVTISESATCPFGIGANPVSLTITDSNGASDSCTGTVTVVDTTAPEAAVNSMLLMAFPRSYALEEYDLSDCVSQVTDNCDTLDVNAAGSIVSISSDEAVITANHDCDADPDVCVDIAIIDNSTFQVRNTRDSYGNGRVYTVDFTVADSAGNSSGVYSCQLGVRLWGTHTPTAGAPAYTVYP